MFIHCAQTIHLVNKEEACRGPSIDLQKVVFGMHTPRSPVLSFFGSTVWRPILVGIESGLSLTKSGLYDRM